MKEKRTNRLSCERARAFPIEKALAKLGHFPTTTNEKEAWFLSPFRLETQASFKVSKTLNRWYDHGEGTGGNVIDLVCKISKSSVKEALRIIGDDKSSFLFQQRPCFEVEQQDRILIKEVKELSHYALRGYLNSRYILFITAKKFIREVHYSFKNKNYFAIGFKNDSGGWELRNKYYKNCSSPKDITHIKKGNEKLIVTEGVFDLLSILEGNEESNLNYDFLVLNSTAFVSKAMEIMKGYLQIDLYLDNDSNGRRTTQKLMARSLNCHDKSKLYEGLKDMNEWLIYNAKKGLGQEARDVSLLPQRHISLYSRRSQRNKKMKRTYIKFRCSIYEKKLLMKRAERAGISLSEYCRSSAFGNPVIERLTDEQSEHYKMLVRYKSNFTRIGNMFRKHNPKLAGEVEQLADEIRTHLYNFKRTKR